MSDVSIALQAVVDSVDGEFREGQQTMAQAVQAGLDSGQHLLVQAGTGTGKSLAYLVPAILHAVQHDAPVVVATATLALQRQLLERDLPAACRALEPIVGRPIRAAVLKGRANYVCLERIHHAGAEGPVEGLPLIGGSRLEMQAMAVREWALQTPTGDRDDFADVVDARVWAGVSVTSRECVGESRCTFGEECFAARARLAAMDADIVVTNHALLAIDAIEGVPVLPEHSAVIVDEAHELVDRITTALSTSLGVQQIDRMITRMRPFVEADQLERLEQARQAWVSAIERETGRVAELPESVEEALVLLDAAARLPARSEPDAARQRAQGSVDEVQSAIALLRAAGSASVLWVDDAERLHCAPLDVAVALQERLFARTPVIMTSATLTVGRGFTAMIDSLGLQQDTMAIDVGSPFDFQQQGILYVAADLPPPGRDGVSEAALERLAALIAAAGGRTLALFSSWSGVDRAATHLAEVLDEAMPLLVQARGESTGPLLDAFAKDPRSCLIGTLGLWQGVDVPGPSCVCVVIDRIPFPRPDDPLIAARQERIDAAGGSGFRSVALPRAALLMAQGSGRLIRSTQDRGVVAVLDSRLANANYGAIVRNSMPPLWYSTDTDAVLGALARLDVEFGATDDAAR